MRKILPIVEVEWVDTMGFPGWSQIKERKNDMEEKDLEVHVSCGYLVAKTKNYIAVAHGQHNEGKVVDSTIRIPRCAVRNVTIIRKKKKGKK